MAVSLLERFVVGELFAFLMIFCRVGAGIMILPGFGEAYVSPRIRLVFALAMSLVMVPLFGMKMPPLPGSPLALFVLIMAETLVGLFIGFFSRMIISALHIAGSIIAFQSSLSLASMLDISQAVQSTMIGNFLTITTIVVFFGLDMHHLMLNGLADSYTLFPPGTFPNPGDMSEHLFKVFSQVFEMAIQLSAPHLVFALLFYLSAGVLARLMPTMQVFFVFMPLQIGIAFFLLLACLTTIIFTYSNFTEDLLRSFLQPE